MANKVTTLIDVSTQDELYPRTKASAVSDNDGNSLGNIAVWNALNVASGIETLKVGLDMDLLWMNADPYAPFESQTINLGGVSSHSSVLIQSLIGSNSTYQAEQIVYYGTGVICTVNGRTYTKDVAGFGLCGVIRSASGYTCGFIVSTDPDVAHIVWSGSGSGTIGNSSTVIDGVTWYYTINGAGWQNQNATGAYTVMSVNGGSDEQGCQNMVSYYTSIVNNPLYAIDIVPKDVGTVINANRAIATADILSRGASVTDAVVEFKDGKKGTTTKNDLYVPYKIYGI